MPRVLVLAVDRDNDVGEATGVVGPVVGYESVLRLAVEFARRMPEDSDLNVLFTALKIAEEKKVEGQDVEVAVVLGDRRDELRADEALSRQLKALRDRVPFEEVVLVTDGPEDEAVVPLVLGHARIVGVKRVVVEQLRGVEETYILIGRYLRKAFTEPRFSRFFLGVPGAILLATALLSLLGLVEYALLTAGVLLGSAMIVRGFNLEERIRELWASSPIMFLASLFSSAFATIALALLYTAIKDAGPSPIGVGSAISSATPFLGLSAVSVFLGKGVVKTLHRDLRVWRDVVGMVAAIVAVLALQDLGISIAENVREWSARELFSAVVASRFIEMTILGIVLTGAITMVSMVIERRYSARG